MKLIKSICISGLIIATTVAQAENQTARELFYSPSKAIFASASSNTTITSNQRVGENFTASDNGSLGAVGNYYESLENPGVSYKIELLRRGSNTPKVVTASHVFKSGDRIRIHVNANADGYMHALHKGSSGNALLVPVSTGGRVANGQNISIPSDSGWMKFDSQKGIEKMDLVFASTPNASQHGMIPTQVNNNSLISNIQQVALKYSNSKSLVTYENSGEKDLIVDAGVNALTPAVINRTGRPANKIEPALYNSPATYAVNTASEPVVVKIELKHQ